jgi:hypothetical protein
MLALRGGAHANPVIDVWGDCKCGPGWVAAYDTCVP